MVVANRCRASCCAVLCALAIAFSPAALGALTSAARDTPGAAAPPSIDAAAPAQPGWEVLVAREPGAIGQGGSGKDPLSHISSCDTGPPLGGMGQCSFKCSAENAGSYGIGTGTISMRCGDRECSVAVPEFTGCDLLGVDRGTVGICRFEGTGAGWCGSF